MPAFNLDDRRTGTVGDGLNLGGWTQYAPLSTFMLTETEQTLRVEAPDLLLVIHVDGHLIEELPSGFHVAVWIVRGEDDAVNADRVRHAPP